MGQLTNSIGCQEEPSCQPIVKIAGIVIVDEQTAGIEDNVFNRLTGKEVANRSSDIKNKMYEISLDCHTSYILFLNNVTDQEPVIPEFARKSEENEITTLINSTNSSPVKSSTLPRPPSKQFSSCSGKSDQKSVIRHPVGSQPFSLACFNPLSPFPSNKSALLMESNSSDHEIKVLASSDSNSQSRESRQTTKEKKESLQIPLKTVKSTVINSQHTDMGYGSYNPQNSNERVLLTPNDPNDFRIPEYNVVIESPAINESTESSDVSKNRPSVDTIISATEMDSDVTSTNDNDQNINSNNKPSFKTTDDETIIDDRKSVKEKRSDSLINLINLDSNNNDPALNFEHPPMQEIFDSNLDRLNSRPKSIPNNSDFFDDNTRESRKSKNSLILKSYEINYHDNFYLSRMSENKTRAVSRAIRVNSGRPAKIKTAMDFDSFCVTYQTKISP